MACRLRSSTNRCGGCPLERLEQREWPYFVHGRIVVLTPREASRESGICFCDLEFLIEQQLVPVYTPSTGGLFVSPLDVQRFIAAQLP